MFVGMVIWLSDGVHELTTLTELDALGITIPNNVPQLEMTDIQMHKFKGI